MDETPFITRAFAIVWDKGEVEAFRILKSEFPTISIDKINELIKNLKGFNSLAFELGNNVHDKHFDRSEAVKRLKATCPGYPEEIYSQAIGKGLHDAMW